MVNQFFAAWQRLGFENSYIGYPTTDEVVNPDGTGRRQHFTGSTIYWTPRNPLSAFSVGGAIADKWYAVGAERPGTMLGYPISDERVLPDGTGRMNRFEYGVIYWHPTTGAHVVLGRILETWSAAGFERSPYGYPTGEQTLETTGRETQAFQHGTITANPPQQTKPYYQPYSGDKTIGDNYSIMTECLQRTRPDEELLTAFPLSGGQTLNCRTLKYIAGKHFQDPHYIPRADWADFQNCVAWTLNDGQEMQDITQPGAEGRTRWNSYGNVRSSVIYSTSNLNIVNAYTSGDGKDWGGCMKTWLG